MSASNSRPFAVGFFALLVLFAAFSRLIPHPSNLTPIGGMALFGAAYFSRKYWAVLVPLVALYLSSVVLDNTLYAQYYEGFVWFSNPFVYVAFGLIALFGTGVLRKISVARIVGGALGASLIFFLVSNFGSWLGNPMYTQDLSGLLSAYAAGLPFLRNTIMGDLFYSGVLFGVYHWYASARPVAAV